MAIHAHRKPEESNDRLQQRFKQQVQKSGLIKMIRERSVRQKKKNTRLQRKSALHRELLRSANKKKRFYSNM